MDGNSTEHKIVNSIVQNIVKDPIFYEKLKLMINRIFNNKKINNADTPFLIHTLIIIYNHQKNIKIERKYIKQVFLLLLKILNDDIEFTDGIDELIKYIDPQIDLLLMSLSDSKCRGCCGSKPTGADEINRIIIKRMNRNN